MSRLMRMPILLVALCWAAGAAPSTTNTPPYLGAGTRRMAELLQKIAREADPAKDMFLSRERAEVLRAQAVAATEPEAALDLYRRLAKELLNAGKSAEALATWENLEERMRAANLELKGPSRAALPIEKALCHLRLAEQANCVLNPTLESCLMPISPGGVHRDQRGSR